jgi:hypothetical protein
MGLFSSKPVKTKSEESTVANSTSSQEQSGTSTQSGWAPVMNQIEGTVLPSISGYGSTYGDGSGIYQGTQLGALDPNVTLGQNSILSAATQYNNQAQDLQGTLQGFLNYDPNSPINQASRDALGANVTAQFNESILPGMQDQATSSGQYGGNQYSLALGAATAPLSRAIADNEFNLMNADRSRAMEAMSMAPELMDTLFTQGTMQNAVGSQRTDRSQLEKADAIQKFNAPRNARLRSILETQGLLTPMAGLSQTGTSSASSEGTSYMDSLTKGTSKTKGGGGGLGGLLQTGLGLASLYTGAGGSFGGLFGGGDTSSGGTSTGSGYDFNSSFGLGGSNAL